MENPPPPDRSGGTEFPQTTLSPGAAPEIETPSAGLADTASAQETAAEQRKTVIFAGLGFLVILALIILGVYFLMQDAARTEQIRDIFIIFMALESLLIGLVLVILIIQMARLINLLQNEIKPILDSTNETVSHLRGTTVFLSDHLIEPVIRMNEYLAGLTQFLQIIGLARKSRSNRDKP